MIRSDSGGRKRRAISSNAAVGLVIVTAIVVGTIGFFVGINGGGHGTTSTATFATTVTESNVGPVDTVTSTQVVGGATIMVTATAATTATSVSTVTSTVSTMTTSTTSVSQGSGGMGMQGR